MFRPRYSWLLMISLLVCGGLYFPGLSGSFHFDDFGALIQNDGLKMQAFSWEGLRQGAWSYAQSGPLGRPVAMTSFTLDYYFHGLNAFYSKLENLLIHLLNGCLVWLLTRQVCRLLAASGDDEPVSKFADSFALFVAIWWLVSPMAMTSVLYVVQRMTSLAATFSLLGLLGYLYFRSRGMASGRRVYLLIAFLVLGCATALSMYTKESGALTLGYAWLLECFVLARAAPPSQAQRVWRRMCIALPFFIVTAYALHLFQNLDWLFQRVPSRDFSPWQRLLTEFRVLAFYMRQIVFPDIAQFGLYHDDFQLSLGWMNPAATLWAAMLHLALLVVAFLSFRRHPLVALGIGWFYMGHLLESTVFPLELVHEHRNYLAMWGLLLSLGYLLFRVTETMPKVRWPGALAILAVFSLITAMRANAMGTGVAYQLHEAQLHPLSARANYDAAGALMGLVRAGKASFHELAPQISSYLDASLTADPNGLAPLVGKISLGVIQQRRPTEALAELERRLREGIPPHSIYVVVISLMEMVGTGAPYFTDDDLERLLTAALENPQLIGISRSAVLGNYGMLLAGMRGDLEGGKALLAKALEITPSASEMRLHYAGILLDSGQSELARVQIDMAKKYDKLGYQTELIKKLEYLQSLQSDAKK